VRHDAPGHNLGEFFVTPPWNAVESVPMPLYPFIIALGYFLPRDLCFSLWFFYLVKLALRVLAAYIGTQPTLLSTFPYFTQQSFGAWFVIVGFALWSARRYLREVWDTIWEPDKTGLDDSDEPLRYRWAAVGWLAGVAFLVFFCLKAGMSWGIILGYFAFYLLLSVAITRLRAELGPPAHEMAGDLNGSGLLTLLLGSQGVGVQNLTIMTLFWWMTGRGYRSHPMPIVLETMKLGKGSDGTGSLKGFGWALVFAFFVGAIASYWAGLHLQYDAGVNVMTAHNWGQFGQVKARAEMPLPPDLPGMGAMVFGAGAALGMAWMRTRFLWWPFHPAGYAIALTFGAEYYWSALLIAWVAKTFILRYGGLALDKKVRPLMYGLILGEYAVGAFWSLLSLFLNQGAVINIKTYDFCPG
jgi:hypothetical protein